MARIAVVDDDPEWAQLLQRVLRDDGYEAQHYPTAGRFFDSLLKGRPELVLLDMQLPGMHGREVIRVLRANKDTKGMIIVAVSGAEIKSRDAVQALDTGADEYLPKPVDIDLLLARMGALLRRGAGGQSVPESKICLGPLSILPEQRAVELKGKPVVLTHIEFDLLVYLVRNADRVLTRGLLLEGVWGGSASMGVRTVDKHVETLRRKLGPFGKNIQTVIRVGYILKV